MNKEINLWKTILASIWSYGLTFLFFGTAVIFALGKIQGNTNVGEICFYGVIALLIIKEIPGLLKLFTFYSYKKDAFVSKEETKK